MSSRNGFLDEQGMVDLARKTIEDLRREEIFPTELRRLENMLKDGGVGEAMILSRLLKTIANELSPDASQKKLLQTHQILADICQSLVHLSRNLFDIEAWQHYRDAGHESFEGYCEKMLGVPPSKIRGLRRIKDQPLPRPKRAEPGELFAWFFDVIENLVTSGTGHGR
jgi:hypothetical protein